MEPTTIELIACVLFGLAILHTFSVKRFEHMAHKYPEGSIGENAYHFLGEVEVVFGLWAGVFIVTMAALNGVAEPIAEDTLPQRETGWYGYTKILNEDLADRDRALCFRTTMLRLIELGVIPILNENDSVSCLGRPYQ